MGGICSKKLVDEAEQPSPPQRVSPFVRRQRSLSRPRPCTAAPQEGSLLALAAEAVAATLLSQQQEALWKLPPDLAQLILDRLVAANRLNGRTVARLAGQQFFELQLEGCPEDALRLASWLRCLVSPSLEVVVLSRTALTDEAMLELGWLPHLEKLHLELCVELTDAGLLALRGLPALEDLSLKGNERLGAAGLQHLAHTPCLRSLDLECCRRVAKLPDWLLRLQLLEVLNLGWCSAVGDEDAAAIGQLTCLRDLRLARTRVSDAGLAHLSSLGRLEVLTLAGLELTDVALARLLPCLPRLRRLDLGRCRKAGDATLAALGGSCRELEELSLAYTRASDRSITALIPLGPRLRVLGLESTDVGDAGLRELLPALTALESLNIEDTSVGNGSMPIICRLKCLRALDLSFTEVDDWGLVRLPRLAPSLVRLNLDSRGFGDAGMEAVGQLSRLTALDLFGARISDTSCRHLCKLHNLQSLEVCGGSLTDAGVALLAAGLPRLAHLSVAHNPRVTNASIAHLLRLSELTALNLSQCRVTGNAVVALGCLSRLETLSLVGTRVRPPTLAALRSVNPGLEVSGVLPPQPQPRAVAA